ncbi:hypothetical protein FSHL1_010045 [Fusarium sambucinum]
MLRHAATHGDQPQHACQFCDRSFVRSDVARRHALACTARPEHDVVRTAKRGRKRQACDYCSSHKLACDAKRPCERCSSRGLNCTLGLVDHYDQKHRPSREHEHYIADKEPEPDRLAVSYLLNLTDPNNPSMMDAMLTEPPDPATPMRSWWNRIPIGNTETEHHLQPQSPGADFNPMSWPMLDPFFSLSLGTGTAADEEFWGFGPASSPFTTSTSQLHARVQLLASELDKINHDPMSAPFFTESNFLAFISAVYRYRHSQLPLLHWPSFILDRASLPLLLAVALSGAIFAHSVDDAAVQGLRPSQELCDTIETYIFNHLEAFDEATVRHHGNPGTSAVEACQAALFIVMIQSSVNCYKTRRRITAKRRTDFVAIVRNLQIFKVRHTHGQREQSWSDFIEVESAIRLAIGTFFMDAMCVLYLNHPPSTTVSEMMGDLPCHECLWNAETELEFETHRALTVSDWRPPPLREVIPGLFEEDWAEEHKKILQRLSINDLHVCLWGESDTRILRQGDAKLVC